MSDWRDDRDRSDEQGLPDTIVCVDCGGICHRVLPPMEDGDVIGDVVTYRCEDCLDRWDLVVGTPDELDELDEIDRRAFDALAGHDRRVDGGGDGGHRGW